MQTLNMNLTGSCPAASCCGVGPLNLPASSATERRHGASSWRKEATRKVTRLLSLNNVATFLRGRLQTRVGSTLAGVAELLVEPTPMSYRHELANERADRVGFCGPSVSQRPVTRSERLVNNIASMLGREGAAAWWRLSQHDNMPHVFLPLHGRSRANTHRGVTLRGHVASCL